MAKLVANSRGDGIGSSLLQSFVNGRLCGNALEANLLAKLGRARIRGINVLLTARRAYQRCSILVENDFGQILGRQSLGQ